MNTSAAAIAGPYVWTGAEIAGLGGWLFDWTPEALREIDTMLANIARRNVTLDDIEPGDFRLTEFAGQIAAIGAALRNGRGFVQIRGLPTEKYDADDLGRLFWILGAELGLGVAQSYKGDRLGHVRDIGEPGRYYTVGGALEMHMDPVDVVGLLCVKKAIRGGESWIASSSAVHNIVAAERPDLLPLLTRGFHYSSRRIDRPEGGAAVTPHRVPVFAEIGGLPASFYLPIAVRAAADNEGVAMTDAEREALALVDEVARRPGVIYEMDLAPGDIQFLNNRLTFHGRADYDDPPEFESKRHLLRLWLTMPDWPERPADMDFHTGHERAYRRHAGG